MLSKLYTLLCGLAHNFYYNLPNKAFVDEVLHRQLKTAIAMKWNETILIRIKAGEKTKLLFSSAKELFDNWGDMIRILKINL